MGNNIVGERNLPRAEGAPQLIEIELHVPITTRTVEWKGRQFILQPDFRWEPSIGLYRQILARIEGETRFHIHRLFNGVCYLCGQEIISKGGGS